jgi:hypothetical protein
MQKKRPVRRETSQGFLDPGHQEGKEIIEAVLITAARLWDSPIPTPSEAVAVPVLVRNNLDARALLGSSRIEGRVNVDHGNRLISDAPLEDLEVVPVVNGVLFHPMTLSALDNTRRVLAVQRKKISKIVAEIDAEYI